MAYIPHNTVTETANAYRNDPGALQQRYGVTRELIDLMSLQRINS
jgi:hypothetical protein